MVPFIVTLFIGLVCIQLDAPIWVPVVLCLLVWAWVFYSDRIEGRREQELERRYDRMEAAQEREDGYGPRW